jgi:hypothetical protein
MAYGGSQLDDFVRRLEKVHDRGHIPKAILVSGGGNDVAGAPFEMLLNHQRSAIGGLNASVLDGVIDQRVRLAFVTILSRVTGVCEAKFGRKLPILTHGYDYPVPDGRGFLGGLGLLPGPWLEPGFRRKGFGGAIETKAMAKELIERFNTMLSAVTPAGRSSSTCPTSTCAARCPPAPATRTGGRTSSIRPRRGTEGRREVREGPGRAALGPRRSDAAPAAAS